MSAYKEKISKIKKLMEILLIHNNKDLCSYLCAQEEFEDEDPKKLYQRIRKHLSNEKTSLEILDKYIESLKENRSVLKKNYILITFNDQQSENEHLDFKKNFDAWVKTQDFKNIKD